MSIDEIREAFESRTIPNLDLKRNEDGRYRFQAAQLAFRDFADGWQAARAPATGQRLGDILVVDIPLAEARSGSTTHQPVDCPDHIMRLAEATNKVAEDWRNRFVELSKQYDALLKRKVQQTVNDAGLALDDLSNATNIPDPNRPGQRIIGWRVDAKKAGLSDALFFLDRLKVLAATPEREAVTQDELKRELMGHPMLHTTCGDSVEPLPLVDMLTPAGESSIVRGIEEADNLAEALLERFDIRRRG
jgi:hypothetical protein